MIDLDEECQVLHQIKSWVTTAGEEWASSSLEVVFFSADSRQILKFHFGGFNGTTKIHMPTKMIAE